MKLKLTLLVFCLFGIGMFSHAQTGKRKPAKPVVEEGMTPLPVMVTASKKPHQPAPPKIVKDAPQTVRSAPPKIVKDPPQSLHSAPPKIVKDAPQAVHSAPPKIVKDPPKPAKISMISKPEKIPAA